MHRNHQKVSGLYLLKSNQDMAVFSKGLGLKNDVFCSRPFLTLLIGSKASTNIWKHVGISQNTFQDTKIIKIGLLDLILGLLKRTQACKCRLKNRYFFIFSNCFHILVSNGPVHLWKWMSAPKYLTGGTNNTIFGHLEQFLAMKMAISHSENWQKKAKFCDFFQLSSTFLCSVVLYISGNESVHQNNLLGPLAVPFLVVWNSF